MSTVEQGYEKPSLGEMNYPAASCGVDDFSPSCHPRTF